MKLVAVGALFVLVGCNAVLGLDERGRAPDAVADSTAANTADTAADTALGADTAANPDDASSDADAVVDTGPPCMFTKCGAVCTDLASDGRHCGSCFNDCDDGQYCVEGACRCRVGGNPCGPGGACVAVTSSRCTGCTGGCPAIGNSFCDTIAATCLAGCRAGEVRCAVGGANDCVNLQTNPFHCGECTKDCNNDEVCVAGNCEKYQPAPKCMSCPCACPVGFTCCPPLPGQTTANCVRGTKC